MLRYRSLPSKSGFAACTWLAFGLLAPGCSQANDGDAVQGSGGSAGADVSGPEGGNSGGAGMGGSGLGGLGGLGGILPLPGGSGGSSTAGDGAGGVAGNADVPRWEAHIRGDVYRKLVIEVDYARGFAPEDGVLEAVFAGFEDILDKPDGIEVRFDEQLEPVGSAHAWSFEQLQALTDEHMNLALEDGVDRIHVLWLDGHDEADGDNGKILGLAWGHRYIVMYKETLAAGCQQLLPTLTAQLCSAAEKAVMTHEGGHVIGLTDNGLAMLTDHKDPDHGAHDIDPDSVMFWAYERDDVFETLLTMLQSDGTASLNFDANSLADIAAVRER